MSALGELLIWASDIVFKKNLYTHTHTHICETLRAGSGIEHARNISSYHYRG